MDYGCRYEPNELSAAEMSAKAPTKAVALKAVAELKESAAWFSTIARCSTDEAIRTIAREQFGRLRSVINEAEANL